MSGAAPSRESAAPRPAEWGRGCAHAARRDPAAPRSCGRRARWAVRRRSPIAVASPLIRTSPGSSRPRRLRAHRVGGGDEPSQHQDRLLPPRQAQRRHHVDSRRPLKSLSANHDLVAPIVCPLRFDPTIDQRIGRPRGWTCRSRPPAWLARRRRPGSSARRSPSRCTCQKPSRTQSAATSMRKTMAARREAEDMGCLWSRTGDVTIGHAPTVKPHRADASALRIARSGVCRGWRRRCPCGLRPNINDPRLSSCVSCGAASPPRSSSL